MGKSIYSREEKEFIRENIRGRFRKEMIEMFYRQFGVSLSENQLKHIMKSIKMNTGRKGGRKKGDPLYSYPGGSEFVSCNGYIRVKTPEGKWKNKHTVIWEEANGKVPEGYLVVFADKNKRNFDLENLILLSRAEQTVMNRHGLHFNDTDLTKAGKMIADLKILVRKRLKEGVKV